MADDIQSRLLPGERILWTGAPSRGLMLTSRDAQMVPFSLFWCGFVAVWMFGAIKASLNPVHGDRMWFFPLFGVPFVLIGLHMLIGRFFHDAWIRRRTSYAVTNQRILILRTAPTLKFTAFAIDRLPELTLEEHANGHGTIRFQPQPTMWNNRDGSSWTPALNTAQFLMIDDARGVFDRIQKAARG